MQVIRLKLPPRNRMPWRQWREALRQAVLAYYNNDKTQQSKTSIGFSASGDQ